MDIASGPLIRITAIAPIPGAEAGAIMVSFLLRFLRFITDKITTYFYLEKKQW
jgi:hypothetical protein